MKRLGGHAREMAFSWAGALLGLPCMLHFGGFNVLHHLSTEQNTALWATALFTLGLVAQKRHPPAMTPGLCTALGFLSTGVTLSMIS